MLRMAACFFFFLLLLLILSLPDLACASTLSFAAFHHFPFQPAKSDDFWQGVGSVWPRFDTDSAPIWDGLEMCRPQLPVARHKSRWPCALRSSHEPGTYQQNLVAKSSSGRFVCGEFGGYPPKVTLHMLKRILIEVELAGLASACSDLSLPAKLWGSLCLPNQGGAFQKPRHPAVPVFLGACFFGGARLSPPRLDYPKKDRQCVL